MDQGDEEIARKVVNYFQSLFNLTLPAINLSTLDCIPFYISEKKNATLSRMSDDKEIKEAVFSLSAHSIVGPDGFNGTFFRVVGTSSIRR